MPARGAGPRCAFGPLLLCAACFLCAGCDSKPLDWSSLISSRIRDQYPDTRIQVLSPHAMQATLGGRTVTVDTDGIALQCNRGPRDCDRAIDQVLLELRGADPRADKK